MAKTAAGAVNVREDVRRVLVYRMGSLGDTVVALPALHLIARAFPNAERKMLTNFPVSVKAPAAAAVLGENGLIHGYLRYVVGTRSVRELAALWWTLLRWRPEVLVYLGPRRGVAAAKRDAKFFRLCGIRWQVGVPVTEEMQGWLMQPETGALEPESERLVRNIAELGDAEIDSRAAWDLGLTAAEEAKAAEVLAGTGERPLLAVSVGTNEFAAEGWRAAAGGAACVVNLCGALTPRESAAVFARAKLFLGHDSGPMHLAAAVGTPCVAIFAARNIPKVWFPHGSRHRVIYHEVDCMGCGLETCIVQQKKCLTSVGVEEVLSAVCESLSEATVAAGSS
jgi:heptosyltransferase-3